MSVPASNVLVRMTTVRGLELEGHAYEKLRESGDYKEGIAAFTEKRKPNFTGA